MSVNIVNQDGSLKKIAHGFPESKFNALLNDVVQYVETGDTASRDYAVGDVFMTMNGQLVRAINAIEEDTAISASDVEEVSVTELIAEHTEKLDNISDGANKVESSTTNGNIKIDGTETPVYRLKGNNTVLATDKTPFLLRQVPTISGASVYVREKLIGCSVAWNQLVQNGNFASSSGWHVPSGTTLSVSGNKATVSKSGATSYVEFYSDGISAISGHKYLLRTKITANCKATFIPTGSASGGVSSCNTNGTNTYWIYNCNTTGFYFLVRLTADTYPIDFQAVFENCQIIDLTLAFGSSVADTLYAMANNGGIDWLRNHNYPIDQYTAYGYNLVSSKTSGKKIVGSNIWNGILIQGHLDGNGNYVSDTGNGVAPDFIKVKSGETYTLKTTSFTAFGAYYMNGYDGNKTHISQFVSTSHTSGTSLTVNVTIPDDVQYIKIQFNNTGTFAGNLYTKCILKKSTVTVDEEYWETTYSLGNDELRGKFDVVNGEIVASGDVKESNGEVQRNYSAEYTLETKAGLNTSGTHKYALYYPTGIKRVSGAVDDCVCDKLAFVSSMGDYFGYYHASNMIVVCVPDSYTVEQFNANIAGSKLIYPLATPTTEQSTPFADPMSLNGATTEEYVDDRTIPVPVGHETQYMGQSEDVVEIPSMPLADGDSVLHCQKSGNEAQYYWESQHMYYKEWVAVGDGTTTYGDLLTQLKPYYEALSEDEKTYSKIMIRANNPNSNECLSFVGAYWYSRVGLSGTSTFSTWFSMVSLENCTYKTLEGDTSWNNTNVATSNSIALRTVTTVRET